MVSLSPKRCFASGSAWHGEAEGRYSVGRRRLLVKAPGNGDRVWQRRDTMGGWIHCLLAAKPRPKDDP